MDKLTEQWRNGTLPRGHYYYKTKIGVEVIGYQCFGLKFPYDYNHNTIDSVKEVLGRVPDYHALQYLKRKLVQAKPELEAWVVKHYGEIER